MPRFCADHNDPGMVEVVNKRCKRCAKGPSFNLKGERVPRFCADHKETCMVNVVNKRCCERCAKIPVFSLGGWARASLLRRPQGDRHGERGEQEVL